MNRQQFLSKLQRFQELLVMSSVGALPTILLGPKLRNILYSSIFARIGKAVFIQEGVEFINTSCIEIGNGVFIFKGARIDGRGHQNNRIYLNDKVAIERNVSIGCLEDSYIDIGQETFIGPGVCIAGPGDIKIGKRCLIAANSGIYANNHNFADPNEPIKYQGITRKGIVIEDDCWLGHGVVVLDGVTIGQGSVIGAGAVVTKNIPPFSVAVGVPAKVMKSRTNKQLVNTRD
ncbi:acyltransferase [Brasilonema bromeliae]|uniref:Acyltransferase n=1 Tax=Brasilonema bromeliae SPC951 TaxID=385972 RepID=A0ABX1PBJ2_9CYAN|nr:DapH/DapD/GlmU-related protein [Brasilonema bromeliae]NMG21820.1 acyltransferase [Brasilonema bromeliae SPC951]